MDLALIIVLASFFSVLSGRAHSLARALDDKLVGSARIFVAAILSGVFAALAMAYLGAFLADQTWGLARALLIVAALLLAAIDLAYPVRMAALEEPTRSLGAITLALLGKQLFDAARWLGFAVAVAIQEPLITAASVSGGGVLAFLAGWRLLKPDFKAWWLRGPRLALAVLALLTACFVAWIANSYGG